MSDATDEYAASSHASKLDLSSEVDQARQLLHSLQMLCPREASPSALTVERQIQSIADELARSVSARSDPLAVFLEATLARHTLVDLCMQRLLDALSAYSPGLSQCLGQIRTMYRGAMMKLPGLATIARQAQAPNQAPTRAPMQAPHQAPRQAYGSSLQVDVQGKMKILQLEEEVDELMKACDALQSEAEQHTEEILQLRTRLRILEAENRELSTKAPGPMSVNSETLLRSSGSLKRPAFSPYKSQMNMPNEIYDWRALHRESVAASLTEGKYLPLKILKDTIEQIYASKARSDSKNGSQMLWTETMNEHMFTFLKNKYGVKPLITENAATLLRSIRRFEGRDNDVAVFSRILNNVIEEDFRLVQMRLKSSFADLLHAHIRAQYPMRTDDVIEQMFQMKEQGDLLEEEWSPIIMYMYNNTDSEIIHEQLFDLIRANHERALDSMPEAPRAETAMMREQIVQAVRKGRIPYATVLKVLLDYQLSMHEEFLRQFHECFTTVDNDEDGEINEEQFVELVGMLLNGFEPETEANPNSAARAQHILATLDPRSQNRFTYSVVVKALGDEIKQAKVIANEKKRQQALAEQQAAEETAEAERRRQAAKQQAPLSPKRTYSKPTVSSNNRQPRQQDQPQQQQQHQQDQQQTPQPRQRFQVRRPKGKATKS